MTGHWTQGERERAYTQLCDAISAAGEKRESLFLARLSLLLAEELGHAEAFERAIAAAALPAEAGSKAEAA